MNARNKYIKRFRPLFLSLLLLVTGGGIAYGQYSIIQNTLQNDVPEKVDTLFLETSEAREVFIPELEGLMMDFHNLNIIVGMYIGTWRITVEQKYLL